MSRDLHSRDAERSRTSRRQGQRTLTDRQLDAYLASREALRRIQRTSALFGDAPASHVIQRSAR